MRVAVVSITLVVVAAMMYRTQMVRHAELLPVAFEHLDHTGEKCVVCHHNYADDTGYDSCYSCHKHDRSVALDIEVMFHDLCRDCHIERARQGEASGPFRVCVECHNTNGRLAQTSALEKR
jgi:Class III cytochrome C family